MASIQRDLVATLKRETNLNVEILSKVRPMPVELIRQIFKENALERPTQNFFYHLAHYLVAIIDSNAANALPWPLYDTKTEREYRTKVSAFINDYSSKGLLSPVMSSYLVNPGCYKVTVLMFQMSQLAVQRLLVTKLQRDSQKARYKSTTEMYKAGDGSFVSYIEQETNKMSKKLHVYICKKEIMLDIAEMLKKKITEMEKKIKTLNCQKYLDNLVDSFLKQHTVDERTKCEILKIKNVQAKTSVFDDWLMQTDERISEMESRWSEKMGPFIQLANTTQINCELLIARSTGEADKNTYMLEYNPRTDSICTNDLQKQVNSQQKYILKNIVKDDLLSFPNLVQGYLIAIGFILKNNEIDDEIYKFNEYLEGGRRNFKEIVFAMKALLERVINVEARLKPSPVIFRKNSTLLSKKSIDIPPMPNLSDLKTIRDGPQVIFDTFTPLNMSKYRFNLHRRTSSTFAKPKPRSLLTSLYQTPRDDFVKSLISCRVSSYDPPITAQNLNMSVKSVRNNETIAECSTGFTKQQIMRLLSTKKSSSSKKIKHKTERPSMNIKKGGLFNESHVSVENNGLFRSHSSPNLFENREKRSRIGDKFAMMQEDCLLEVSGITTLEKDSFGTPENVQLDSSRKLLDATSLPIISVSPPQDCSTVQGIETAPYTVHFADLNLPKMQELLTKEDTKTETPKNNQYIITKTSSLEKIINRFKRVRANVLPPEKTEDTDFKTIVEEKENLNTVNHFTANRVLLPDLLSPSCSLLQQSTDYLDQVCLDIEEVVCRKPRESLGTALGVDQTFLDQYDLID